MMRASKRTATQTRRRTAVLRILFLALAATLLATLALACGGEDKPDTTRVVTPGSERSRTAEAGAEDLTPTVRGQNPPSVGVATGCALPAVEDAPAQRGLSADIVCAPLPEGYVAEEYVSGLRRPVAMAFAPDGRMFVTEQHTGNVRVVIDGELLPVPFTTVERLFISHEAGLLGIALDPDFEENHYVYIFYNAIDLFPREHFNKVVRYTEVDNVGTDRVEIIPDMPGIRNQIHTAGNIHFGPDGYLYITLGELERPEEVQDLSLLPGKILRVDRDGAAAPGNPFEGRLNIDARIYAYGLRNAFDFDFHPVTGTIIAVDNGDSTDEINRIVPGGNYGHPDVIGPSDNADFIDPIIYYEFPVGPAGASFYSGDKLPEFKNNFFFCQFHQGGLLHRVQFAGDGDEVVIEDTLLAGSCTSDVAEGPDGYLYFADVNSGVIHRITDGG